ncbi:DCC1-like thiol-disulfide oxidoreductase family protein, partial [Escherichia coli]|nr:DCC1-like thiol-disulfide oxidoreductase family protein [Escherichia coli]
FSAYPQIDPDRANTILHALDNHGNLLLGLDVTYRAWQLVGRGWLYAPLRWQLIRPVADWLYLRFAQNRYRISYWLTGTSRCNSGRCSR